MVKTAPRVAKLDELSFMPRFAHGDQAEVAEVSGTGDDTKLGTGFVRLRNADILWTIKYDEVILVLDGALTIRLSEGSITAGAQECIWLPAGTELTYQAENALVFYAIQPADWATANGGAV